MTNEKKAARPRPPRLLKGAAAAGAGLAIAPYLAKSGGVSAAMRQSAPPTSGAARGRW